MKNSFIIPLLFIAMTTPAFAASEITGTLTAGSGTSSLSGTVSGTGTTSTSSGSLGGSVTPSSGSVSGTVSAPPSSASGGTSGGGGGSNGPPVGLITTPLGIGGGAVLGTSTVAQAATTPTVPTTTIMPSVGNAGAGAALPVTLLTLALSAFAALGSVLYLRSQVRLW